VVKEISLSIDMRKTVEYIDSTSTRPGRRDRWLTVLGALNLNQWSA
jgi:hypothetical protein